MNPEGEEVYVESRYNIYDDVDPSPVGKWTVSYVAAVVLSGEDCKEFETDQCTRNFIERLNFSTGEKNRLYVEKTAGVTNTRWHDADRIGPNRFLLGDIVNESVAVVDTQNDTRVWEWHLSSDYNRSVDGAQDDPNDWAHLNDVEKLSDGSIMLSPRNFDRVVFYNREEEINDSRTLGAEDNYSILYEQHNPDYLTAANTSPSVLVADSQNNRIVEYARQDGKWIQTWEWTDAQMRWPRDADRLPNGHTLIADTSGGRVIEIDTSGDIVWSVQIKGTYDVERIGTRDESAGGPQAAAADLRSRDSHPMYKEITQKPGVSLALNGILFVLPKWAGVYSVLGVLVIGGSVLSGLAVEIVWKVTAKFDISYLNFE